MSRANQKTPSWPRVWTPLVIAGAIFLFTIGIFVTYETFLYFHPQAGLNSQTFRPTSLPEGVHLGRTVLFVYQAGILPGSYELDMRTALTGRNSWLSQREDAGFNYHCDLRGNTTCRVGITPQGQRYVHQVIFGASDLRARPIVYETPALEEIWFVRDETLIQISLQVRDSRTIEEAEWEYTIDSFKPYKIESPQVHRVRLGA